MAFNHWGWDRTCLTELGSTLARNYFGVKLHVLPLVCICELVLSSGTGLWDGSKVELGAMGVDKVTN